MSGITQEYDPVQTAREWFEDTLSDRPDGSPESEAAIKRVDALPGSARGKACKQIHDAFKGNGGNFDAAVLAAAGDTEAAHKEHADKAKKLGLSEVDYDGDDDGE